MKVLSRITWCFAATVLALTSVLAQDNKLSPIAKRKFRHKAVIETMYQEDKSQTVVTIRRPYIVRRSVPNSGADTIAIKAGFYYPGRNSSSTQKVVELGVLSQYTGEWRFKNISEPELIAVVDGMSISLGRMTLERAKTFAYPSSPVNNAQFYQIEDLYARFTYEGLLRLANAKKVTMRIGRVEFALEEEHLELFRDLASRMAQ